MTWPTAPAFKFLTVYLRPQYIACPSRNGISSVNLGRLIGISQKKPVKTGEPNQKAVGINLNPSLSLSKKESLTCIGY